MEPKFPPQEIFRNIIKKNDDYRLYLLEGGGVVFFPA